MSFFFVVDRLADSIQDSKSLAASDCFSIGRMIAELITGSPLFPPCVILDTYIIDKRNLYNNILGPLPTRVEKCFRKVLSSRSGLERVLLQGHALRDTRRLDGSVPFLRVSVYCG